MRRDGRRRVIQISQATSARTHEEGRQVPPRPEPRRAAREVRRSLPIASKHHATGTLALLLCACVRLSDVEDNRMSRPDDLRNLALRLLVVQVVYFLFGYVAQIPPRDRAPCYGHLNSPPRRFTRRSCRIAPRDHPLRFAPWLHQRAHRSPAIRRRSYAPHVHWRSWPFAATPSCMPYRTVRQPFLASRRRC